MRSQSIASKTASPALYDKWLVFAILAILMIGLIMMTSASIVISDKMTHQPFYFLFKQLILLSVGIVLGSFIIKIDIRNWEHHGGYLLLATLVSLSMVLIPGIGHRVNGSMRWIGIGPLGFQVSEMAKLIIIIYMAGYLYRRHSEIRQHLSGFLKPMAILAIVSALLLREPDFGATVVIFATSLGMMFLAGMRLRHFFLLLSLIVLALAFIAISEPYRLERLSIFLNPWARPFDSGYQLTQSLMAFGRGGWWGVGLGNSIQKMFYLPEAHTDFLFAVIAEELGLAGIMVVFSLYALLIYRVMAIGRMAQQLNEDFAGFLAYGLGLWLTIQFIVNIGVNTGLLPTKGLTLPMMSYGGSSILVNCLCIALLLRIDHENRLKALGIRE
jgi:cell division protein FtsW